VVGGVLSVASALVGGRGWLGLTGIRALPRFGHDLGLLMPACGPVLAGSEPGAGRGLVRVQHGIYDDLAGSPLLLRRLGLAADQEDSGGKGQGYGSAHDHGCSR
jgi:hypothetical protein